jgi:ubiquinone/menaquinone biosynthesis C-methylase UbiE
MEQEEVWDVVAGKWAEFRQVGKPTVVEFLKDKKGKVLDIGCGSGRHFVEGDLEFYGVDFSEEMVRLARGKGYVEVRKSGADELPFDDGFFDYVIFAAALHCVDSVEGRRKAVEEMFRVLKKGGEGVVTVLSRGHERVKGKECFIPWSSGTDRVERYYYVYDADEIRELFEGVGFEVLSLVEDSRNISLVVGKR